ncbi:ATP synthase subunit b [Frankliniella fusca]|uniref:ATP synthase subunit b n=1 Tax=Frankliniella fusca TaxID=407009 RepID=A0AAE1HZY5_9NEOP|nr:ATP synthase subunit b [Frankliniella fusca]
MATYTLFDAYFEDVQLRAHGPVEMDASLMSECDFVLNDGEVTVIGDMTVVGDVTIVDDMTLGKNDSAVSSKQDGSDSGVELNGAERSTSPTLGLDTDTPLTGTPRGTSGPGPLPPAHLDYDGTSEGGSESSSVLSHTPVRKKVSSASSSSASCSTPGRPAGHPRSRSVASSGAASTAAPPAGAPKPRERSLAGRGASCSRGRQPSVSDSGPPAPSRTAPRTQRSGSSSGSSTLMTSSLTGSLTAGNVRGRGATRAPSAPRPAPRGSASAMSASTDDGRWPSTVQRPTTLSRTRASSVATDRERRSAAPGMTSSSSKNSVNSTNSASTPSPTVESKCDKFSTLPRRRRRRSVESIERASATTLQSARKQKVTLYHETEAQTALTIQDLEDLLGGKACQLKPVDAKELCDRSVQVDRERDDFATLMLDRRLKAIIDMLGFEHSGAPRSPGGNITSTVQTPPKEIDHTAWMKSLELLEQRATTIKKRDLLQRNEIGRLRYEVERADRLRKELLKHQEETEAETIEMQEFLQVEKCMMAESLKEAEKEIQDQKKTIDTLSEELVKQQEECQHLVRISEQRSQEVLTLQARVAALEQRSRESLLQQGAAVSGASVALSALSSRLIELAVQLEESSVERALSTLSTEAEAVTTRTKEVCRPLSLHLENNFQTLDTVTEPELEEEGGGGQRDSTISETNDSRLVNSESIQNLSAAIFRRLQEEALKTETSTMDEVPGNLIDQVLDIDSSITRVLRAISDAVHAKKLASAVTEEPIGNLAIHHQASFALFQTVVETTVFQKIDDNSEATIPTHIPILNSSSEGSCSDNKVAVSLKSEPVTGAA